MARIFITGSADGLGQLAARLLIEQGHAVVLHARNSARAKEANKRVSHAEGVLVGDLSNVSETIALAEQVNQSARFDAVIHNAGVYQTTGQQIFSVNVMAPYILSCLIEKPKRLIYLSSGMHLQGRPNIDLITSNIDRLSYADSKLHVVMMMLAIARKWPEVYANAVDPGWVPTKMGGRNAPDNLQKGYETQSWLAVSKDPAACVSGRYFFHQKQRPFNPLANDTTSQERLFNVLAEMSGVSFPG